MTLPQPLRDLFFYGILYTRLIWLEFHLFWAFLVRGISFRLAPLADVAERYTRLSQKQVPQGLRVRISPPALLIYCYPSLSIPRSNPCRLSTETTKNLLLSFGFAVNIAVSIK